MQTSSGSATLSAAEQLLQAAAVTKKADAIVRVNDLREKGYHLHSQGPKQAHTRTSGQAAVEAKLLSGRKLKKLGVSKLDQHLRWCQASALYMLILSHSGNLRRVNTQVRRSCADCCSLAGVCKLFCAPTRQSSLQADFQWVSRVYLP